MAEQSEESFLINNTILSINPTDISVLEKRNLKTNQFLRDNGSYTVNSKFTSGQHNNFSIVIAFDTTIKTEILKLTRLVSSIDKFPFAFIKSSTLERLVFPLSKDINRTYIYGVQSFTVTQKAEAQEVIFLELVVTFFNYHPFARDFIFIENDIVKKQKKTPFKTKKDKDGKEVKVKEYSELTDSKVYDEFINDFYEERKRKVEEVLQEEDNFFVDLSYPVISDKISEEDKKKNKEDQYKEITITGIHPEAEKAGIYPKTIYVKWNKIKKESSDHTFNNPGIGESFVGDIKITRRNNFAYQNISGWNYPILQYLGKGQTTLRMSAVLEKYSQGDETSVINRFKHALKTLDVNFTKYPRYFSYNTLRVHCLLSAIVPSFGYVLDNESITNSSTAEDIAIFNLTLRESNTKGMLERSRYNAAGSRSPEFSISEMISTIKKVINSKNKPLDTSQYHSVGVFKTPKYQIEVDSEMRSLFSDLVEAPRDVKYSGKNLENSGFFERFLDNINLKNRSSLINKVSNFHMAGTPISIASNLQEIFLKNYSDERLLALLDYRLSIAEDNIHQAELKSKLDQIIEDHFFNLLKSGNAGNPIVRPYIQGYVNKMVEDFKSLSDSFDGDALPDLDITKSLPIYLTKNSLKGQDLPAFFFLKSKSYIDQQLLQKSYDTNSSITDEVMAQKLETISKLNTETDEQEELKPFQAKSISSDFEHVELQNEFLNSGEDLKPPKEYRLKEDIFKTSDRENVDPFDERDQAYYQMLQISEHFTKGLNLAIPAIKIYMVTHDDENLKNMFSNQDHMYFELMGIQSVRIVTNNDENPVDTCHIKVGNPSSVYTDDTMYFSSGGPYKDNPTLSGTSEEIKFKFNQLRVRPGNRIHIRMGYSNNINHLTTVFNGLITEVGGGEILDVIAEGFGRELISYKHGEDPAEDNFFISADTKSIIANAIYSKEVSHFGNWKFETPGSSDEEMRNLFSLDPHGIFKYSFPTDRFTNLYVDEIIDKDESFGTDILEGLFNPFSGRQMNYHFPIYKSTPFDMLKEMEFRHPTTLSKPLIYGTRMTYFFGIKEQLYIYRDLKNKFMERKEAGSFYLPDLFSTSLGEDIYKKLRSGRFKPVSNFHFFTSENNIILNDLRVSANFNTVVNIKYYGDEDDLEDNDFDYYEMKADDNLKSSAHRRGELSMLGIHGEYLSYRYGQTYLRRELEKMYEGKILVIGNPNIKAGDYAALNDSHRGLKGIIKIREATHHFDLQNGFVTEIKPGLYCESSLMDNSQLFTKLHAGLDQIAYLIKNAVNASIISGSAYLNMSTILDLAKLKNNQGNRSFFDDALGVAAEAGGVGLTALGVLSSSSKLKVGQGLILDKIVKYDKPRLKSLISNTIKGGVNLSSYAKSAYQTFKSSGLLSAVGTTALNLGKGALAFTRAMPIVGWAASLVVGSLTSAYEEESMTRQPVRIYPLLLNNKMYIGGIDGFKDNSYFESVGDNLMDTIEDAEILGKYITSIF